MSSELPRRSRPSRRRPPGPAFRPNETLRMFTFVTMIVVLLVAMNRLHQPGSLNWLFPQTQVQTEVVETPTDLGAIPENFVEIVGDGADAKPPANAKPSGPAKSAALIPASPETAGVRPGPVSAPGAGSVGTTSAVPPGGLVLAQGPKADPPQPASEADSASVDADATATAAAVQPDPAPANAAGRSQKAPAADGDLDAAAPDPDAAPADAGPMPEATTAADADTPTEEGEDRPAVECAYNPLNLTNCDQCQEVNIFLLKEVEDEINFAPRGAATEAEVYKRRARATPSLYQTLCVASTTPPEQLAAKINRDLQWPNLWRQPWLYRGQVVRVRGRLVRLELEQDQLAARNGYGIDKLYSAWIDLPEYNAYVRVIMAKPPEGVPLSNELSETVVCDGFFFKLYQYRGQDEKAHGVPLVLAASLKVIKIDSSGFRQDVLWAVVGMVVMLMFIMIVFWWRGRADQAFADQLRASIDSRTRDGLAAVAADGPFAGGPAGERHDQAAGPADRTTAESSGTGETNSGEPPANPFR